MPTPYLSFSPDDPRDRRTSNRRQRPTATGASAWTAPEHGRLAKGMERDRAGNLILDPRPEMLRPRRETRQMF